MTLKLTPLIIYGNRGFEINGSTYTQRKSTLNSTLFVFTPLELFFNLTAIAASIGNIFCILQSMIAASQFSFVNPNPPLNRSAQLRSLPTGIGHQRARLALR